MSSQTKCVPSESLCSPNRAIAKTVPRDGGISDRVSDSIAPVVHVSPLTSETVRRYVHDPGANAREVCASLHGGGTSCNPKMRRCGMRLLFSSA